MQRVFVVAGAVFGAQGHVVGGQRAEHQRIVRGLEGVKEHALRVRMLHGHQLAGEQRTAPARISFYNPWKPPCQIFGKVFFLLSMG